jgi:Carbohydrate binding module (family 6)
MKLQKLNLNGLERSVFSAAMLFLCVLTGCRSMDPRPSSAFPPDYQGRPFADARYGGGPQKIPGRVKLAYYDFGGEGIAFHDTTPKNLGSGGLNPLNGDYFNEFRHAEAVDTSYTKSCCDTNPYDMVVPELDQLYVGWTEAGEWLNLTVDIVKAGDYSVNLMYTCNGPGVISLAVNRRDATGPLALVNTHNPQETIAWRQWHHWNKMTVLAKLHLAAGRQLLTLQVVANGNMNFDYLEFVPEK